MSKLSAFILAAGLGTRLYPLTKDWPKCLMPIKGVPLLSYWLSELRLAGICKVGINTHYFSDEVHKFLSRPSYVDWVQPFYEKNLLGTAATIAKNFDFFPTGSPSLILHADNWVVCNLKLFLDYHLYLRPSGTLMTMMTFDSKVPEECGIVELSNSGIVVGFHEKVKNPPGTIANGAIYIMEPEVISWIKQNPSINNISTQVLGKFTGQIATWHNKGIHRDIGTIQSLLDSQEDINNKHDFLHDSWSSWFSKHPIHREISLLRDKKNSSL